MGSLFSLDQSAVAFKVGEIWFVAGSIPESRVEKQFVEIIVKLDFERQSPSMFEEIPE